jgi:hypothetical protein
MDPTTGLHVPTPISPKYFERDHLTPLSYTQEAISTAIVANANRGFNTTLRNLSIRQTHSFNRFFYTGFWSIGQPGHIDNLKRVFDLFDDAYFGGLLKGYCTLELIEERHCHVFAISRIFEEFVSLGCQDMKEIQGLGWNYPELTLSSRKNSEMENAD